MLPSRSSGPSFRVTRHIGTCPCHATLQVTQISAERSEDLRKLKLVALLAIAAAVVVGCTAAVAPARGGTVNATLTEMKIAVDRKASRPVRTPS